MATTTPDSKPQPSSKITPPGKALAAPDESGKWKMLIVQDGAARSVVQSSPTPKTEQHALLHLPHPRHGERALFMIDGDHILEMRRARRPEYACWFVGDRCESQGDILFGTRMDPLFLALPALDKARNKTSEHQGRFQSKDQIFGAWAETCDAAFVLAKLQAMELEVICDVQEVNEDCYYRLNDDKVIAWVESKVLAVLGLKYPDLNVAQWKTDMSGSNSSDGPTGLSRDEQIARIQLADKARGDKDRIVFGAAVVADYLPASWASMLLATLHLSLSDLEGKRKTAAPQPMPEEGEVGSSGGAGAKRGGEAMGDTNENKKARGGAAPSAASTGSGGGGKTLTKAQQFVKKGLSTKGMASMASFFKPVSK